MPIELTPVDPNSVVLNCISYNDTLNYLDQCGIPTELCGSQFKVESNIEEALELVEAITETVWCSEIKCFTFKGSGDCYLYWNFENSTPLESITTLKIDTVLQDLDDFVVDKHYIRIKEDKFNCCDNIEVCGRWGLTIPKNIKKAIILLALEYSSPGITGISKIQEASKVTWEDFSIDYSDKIREEYGFTTGFSEIDRLIFPFIPTLSQINFTSIDNNCVKKCCTEKGCSCQE